MSGKSKQDASQYKYEEMSGKVTRADRRLLDDPQSRKDREVSSNPESLVNKISVKDMGSRVRTSKAATKHKSRLEGIEKKRSSDDKKVKMGGLGQEEIADLESLIYVPKTAETQQIYSLLLSWSSVQMDSDVPHNVVLSLTDLILQILKDENTTDNDKKSKVEQALEHSLSSDEFQKLLSLSKQITDYEDSDSEFSEEEEHEIPITFEDEDDKIDGEELQSNLLKNLSDADEEEEERFDDVSGQIESSDSRVMLENEDIITFNASGNLKGETEDEILPLNSIDQYFLRRLVATELSSNDAVRNSKNAETLFKLIEKVVKEGLGVRFLENELMEFFEFEHSELIERIIKHHIKIYYGILLSSLHTKEEKLDIHIEMKKNGLQSFIDEGIVGSDPDISRKRALVENTRKTTKKQKLQNKEEIRAPRVVDFDGMVFDQGSHLITSTKIELPEGAYKLPKKYEEYHIPAPEPPKFAANERLVPITDLPEWIQPVFPSSETKTLNRIQSRVYPTAFNSDENILMCAPTGAGKTNVAMLTILRTLSKFRNELGSFDIDKFKIVYIAPLKALVQEQVREFQRRLLPFGIMVSELTGDSNLTKLQISSTQVIVTTPEKWDVITRKMSDLSYVNLVRLVIIDEIHLLHDERGPVLESIVARTLRSIDLDDNEPVRLIGLSATLPNYKDVATFLRVDEQRGLFYFDSSYRPCPLAQQFVGISDKNAFARQHAMNEVCYEKVLENVSNGHQVIVFVHSRKETAKTAEWIKDKMLEKETLNKILGSDSASIEVLKEESENCSNSRLKDLLPSGFAIHHAGLSREDRSRSEDLFAAGHVKVLVCTATLAWGVNLPAHTVIIKGTSVYSPEKGAWVELSPQDILQMLGRAGRPRYDKSGEGIILTSKDEVKYYLAILNQQLPIESQLISKLVDNINAEVVLGSVKSLTDAVNWLAYTYLYVRMMRSPAIYHVGVEYEGDDHLKNKRTDLAHTALTLLNKSMLVKYDVETGKVTATDLGRIASHYYITYQSISLYNNQLKSHSSPLDILRIFSQSGEFKYLPVRSEEKPEISRLLEISPIPIRESSDDPLAKINVLLQSYISRYRLDGFALLADMIYITQSAGRLIRALHEIALKKCWSLTAKILLDFCKMIDRRMWLPNSPFRQFPNVPQEIVRKTEGSQIPWSHYLNLTDAAEMSQAIRSEKLGKTALELVEKFPKLSVNSSCQPITSSLIRVELEILPQWVWDTEVHGFAESFLLLVEDCDGNKIIYTDSLLVKRSHINEEHLIDFTVPVLEPLQPNYFVSLISEKWLNCETKVPILLNKIKIPKKFPAPTPLINLQPVPISDLNQKEFEDCFNFKELNKFQTQVFNSLYNTNENVFIGASKGSGKTVCAEFAILNHWRQGKGRIVYITPNQVNIDKLHRDWASRFENIGGGKKITKLVGDISQDLKLIESSHLILATVNQFEMVSRRWKNRKSIQSIELLIADDSHSIGSGIDGCAYEVLIARMRFISLQLEKDLRIVALAVSLANGKDFAEWIGVSKNNIFNFSSSEKVNPLNVHIQSFSINHNPSLLLAMTKPAFDLVKDLASHEGTAVIFVPTRKHCIEIGSDFINHANSEGIDFLKAEISSLENYLVKVKDLKLREALSNGIGFYYSDMAPGDRKIVDKLFKLGALTVLFATRETCTYCPVANTVVVLSTQFYEGREHRYISYPISDLLEMIGVARNTEKPAVVSIFTNLSSREYYKKFINESLPLESHLNIFLHDALVNEITTKVISSKQSCIDWLTYSYFYRRLQMNPSFYGVRDTSHIGLSEYLSELVETTLQELEEAKMIEIEENEKENEEEAIDEIIPQNGAMIAAHYNVSFVTMQTFTSSLSSKTKLKGLMEIVTAAAEFENVPVRAHEASVLTKIYNRLPMKSSNADYNSPHFKSFILLQAHFSRMSLPQDLISDQKYVLERVMNLLYTAIDILSTEGNLNAVTAMDLAQMIVQAVWDNDSPLKQVPFFDETMIKKCTKMEVETVYDIMSLEDDERDELLNLSTKEVSKIAEFVNKYPNIDISYKLDLSEQIRANEDNFITINIERDEDVDDLTVVAPFYPLKKIENWWIALGEPTTKQLYAIKKVTIQKKTQSINLSYSIPDTGIHKLAIWCICDSYMDADKEIFFDLEVFEGGEKDSGDEEV